MIIFIHWLTNIQRSCIPTPPTFKPKLQRRRGPVRLWQPSAASASRSQHRQHHGSSEARRQALRRHSKAKPVSHSAPHARRSTVPVSHLHRRMLHDCPPGGLQGGVCARRGRDCTMPHPSLHGHPQALRRYLAQGKKDSNAAEEDCPRYPSGWRRGPDANCRL